MLYNDSHPQLSGQMSEKIQRTRSLPFPYGFPLSELGAPPYKSSGNEVLNQGRAWEYRFGHHLANQWGHVPQHRLVAEHCLGRELAPGEVIHHEDEDKRNNSSENLWMFPTQGEHLRHHQRLQPLHDLELVAALRPMAADWRIGQANAAKALGVSKSTIHKILVLHGIPWANSLSHPLTPEEVQKALRGHSTLEAANLLGVNHQTLRNRFGSLLQKRASPLTLDVHKEEIRNLAKTMRTSQLMDRFGVCKPTVIAAIRRWTKEEPDAWSDVTEFRQRRHGMKWSPERRAAHQSRVSSQRAGRPPRSGPIRRL